MGLRRWSLLRLLNQLGLSSHWPLWRAYQQDPAMVSQWVHLQYPKIFAVARKMKAEINSGNEAYVRTDHHARTTCARSGQTPVVSSTVGRFVLNFEFDSQFTGLLRFLWFRGCVGARQVLAFLRRLLRGQKQPIFSDSVQASRVSRPIFLEFVETSKSQLCLIYFPLYDQEYNLE